MRHPPLPGPEDYPVTLLDFEKRFATEAACRQYLEEIRWPEGFRCPSCNHPSGWRTSREQWFCRKCCRQTSATAGTIFDGTRKPLRLWFRIMWLVTSQKTGASALNVQRQMGLRRYETVWTWLHKLRRAMVRPGRDRLSGRVEVDETYVGGVEPGKQGRSRGGKALVAIAAQVDGTGIGRIRLHRIPDASSRSLLPCVQEVVEPGSTVTTDGWNGYEGLQSLGYRHKVRIISESGKTASTLLPRVHRVAALLKRWLLGTHQGAVRVSHLDYYLDEFTFRFNRRASRSRGKLFYRLLQQAAQIGPVPWNAVVSAQVRANPKG